MNNNREGYSKITNEIKDSYVSIKEIFENEVSKKLREYGLGPLDINYGLGGKDKYISSIMKKISEEADNYILDNYDIIKGKLDNKMKLGFEILRKIIKFYEQNPSNYVEKMKYFSDINSIVDRILIKYSKLDFINDILKK